MDEQTKTALVLLLVAAGGLLVIAASAVIEANVTVGELWDRLVRRVRGW